MPLIRNLAHIVIAILIWTTPSPARQEIVNGDRVTISGIWVDRSNTYLYIDVGRTDTIKDMHGKNDTKKTLYSVDFRSMEYLDKIINGWRLKIGDKIIVNAIANDNSTVTNPKDKIQLISPFGSCYIRYFDFISFDSNYEKSILSEYDRLREENEKANAEAKFQAAQTKMRIEEEQEKIREQRLSDLKSGKMKITNIEDAKLAFNPSSDQKYTFGLPIDGLTNTGEYYIWSGTLSWKSGQSYFCLDNYGGQTKCFGFTNLVVRFNEMRENSQVTVVGKLTGTSEVTLINKLSGVKENKTVALLTECYVF